MEFGQSIRVLVSWLVVAVVITVSSNPVTPVNSLMTNCSCGPGDTSLEGQKDLIRGLNRSAQNALDFYQDSVIPNRKIYRQFIGEAKVTLRLPEARTAADLGAMHDTNIDCLTKVMQMVILMGNDIDASITTSRQEQRQKMEIIRGRTCDAYCRLTGSRTRSSAPLTECVPSLERCPRQHCTTIIRLRDIRNIAIEMVQRYESLGVSHSSSN